MDNQRNEHKLTAAASQNLAERQYWLDRLAGEPVKTVFAADYKKSKSTPPEMRVDLEFPQGLAANLLHLSKGSNYTLNVLLAAGVVSVLHRCTESRDIILGMPIFKQDEGQDFINTVLAIRSELTEDMTFKELLVQLGQRITEADENQNYPIELLPQQLDIAVSQGDDGFPLFDIAFLLENVHERSYLDAVKINMIFSFLRSGEMLSGHVAFNGSLYKEETVRRIGERLIRFLAAGSSNPGVAVKAVDLMNQGERKRLLEDFNAVTTDLPLDATLNRLFEDRVAERPHSLAVKGNGLTVGAMSLTYLELSLRTDKLAWLLRQKGIGCDTVVAVLMDRSIEMMVAILAVLKAGGAYLPIDPGYPRERVEYMLADTSAPLLITQDKYRRDCDFDIDVVDMERQDLWDGPAPSPGEINHGWNLAYIIYTSGTTGKPKGILTTHTNAVRVVRDTNYIDLNARDRLLQLSNYAFDGSIFDIYGALLNGALLVQVDPLYTAAVDRLAGLILRERISVFFLTTALFNALVDVRLESLKYVRKILFGGERVSVEHSLKALDFMGPGRILHVYGPTETTVYATFYPIEHIHEAALTVPIGGPIANTEVYILDKDLRPVPTGIPGEIYIGGRGTARGYLNRPELTFEKFVARPAHLPPTSRFEKQAAGQKLQSPDESKQREVLYRTGDLARQLDDGNIEFLGRIDSQVKIRGFRIELGEIESCLLKREDIKEAVVLDRKSESGDKYLCAYIVSNDDQSGPLPGELREWLAKSLPDYMIPQFFVNLEKMPLNANGKTDTRKLPEPRLSSAANYAPPTNARQEQLLEIWADLLNLDKESVGIDDDFFQVGGHSIKVTLLASRIYKETGVKIALSQVFRHPTIRELAALIDSGKKDSFIALPRAEKKPYYPLSSAQERLYVEQYRVVDNLSYNVQTVAGLVGRLDLRNLELALAQLIDRHEILRTGFVMVDNQPMQKIEPRVDFKLEFYQAPGDCDKAWQEAARGNFNAALSPGLERVLAEFVRPFDLERPPLFRMGLIKAAPDRYIVMVDFHHIVVDLVSFTLFFKELIQLYALKGEAGPDPLRLQYKDFSQWQNGPDRKEALKLQERFWLDLFKDGVPQLNLGLDYKRPQTQDFKGSAVTFQTGIEETRALKELAEQEKVTLFMLFLSFFYVFLAKVCDQDDIVVGTPIAGRRYPGLEKLIGFFLNNLALRAFPAGDKPFKDFLSEVKASVLEAFDNQDYPFDDLVEQLLKDRTQGPRTLFDVVFVYQDPEKVDIVGPENTGLKLIPFRYEIKRTPYDLMLHVYHRGEVIEFVFHYKTELFKKETVVAYIGHFKTLVAAVLDNCGIALHAVPMAHDLLAAEVSTPEDEGDFDF